jgi:Uma2 family endonuclease
MAIQSNALTVEEPVYELDYSNIVTEDDEPVDNIFSAVQQRLLVEPLYSSWAGPGDGRRFFAESNIGVFYMLKAPPLVPDALLSLDVQADEDIWAKEHRSYFIWEFGKPPDVVIEVVSNKIGGEDTTKIEKYARMRIPYYVIFDPGQHLGTEILRIYRQEGYSYQRYDSTQLAGTYLGVTLWEGVYSEMPALWLRWVDEQGNLILTGKELAERAQAAAERAQVAAERAQVEAERAQAEKVVAQQRAEKLAALLRQLGQDPDQI